VRGVFARDVCIVKLDEKLSEIDHLSKGQGEHGANEHVLLTISLLVSVIHNPRPRMILRPYYF
jgi:hypothetical protein